MAPPSGSAVVDRRCKVDICRLTKKSFERLGGRVVELNRLRRFGRRHVFRICCFSCVRCPNPFFIGNVRPFRQ
jgi:hypothetical protein